MAAEYGFAPLPPPPPPASAQTSPQRRVFPVRPPLITTALAPPPQGSWLQTHTPLSTTTLSTPFTPYAPSSVGSRPTSIGSSPLEIRTPSTMVTAYNPQEWGRNGPIGGSYMPHHVASAPQRAREITGMEAALPSPPPPYSPPPHQQSMSQALQSSPHIQTGSFANNHTASPSALSPDYAGPLSGGRITSPGSSAFDYSRVQPAGPSTSPNPVAAPSFPPPPPRSGRDRSVSRSRPEGQRSLFSLSALTSRNRGADPSPAPSAIDTLRQHTTDALSRAPVQVTSGPSGPPPSYISAVPSQREPQWTPDSQPRPPAARRAASTGGIGLTGSPARSRAESQSPSRLAGWEPGMPLPPPPPGPPPSSSRSQSLSRTSDRSSASSGHIAAPAPRRPLQASTLGPIPPTPADWVEEPQPGRASGMRGLQVDTSYSGLPQSSRAQDTASYQAQNITEPHTAHPSSSGGLSRTPARREPSARGIRERRSESRAARERMTEAQSAIEPSNNPWAQDMESVASSNGSSSQAAKPADLILPAVNGAISRRRTVKQSAHSRGKSISTPQDTPLSGQMKKPYGDLQTPGSSYSTPRANTSERILSTEASVPTPPFSPATEGWNSARMKSASTALSSKTLPTPPFNRSREDLPSSFSLSVGSHNSQNRPISHILHTPNEDNSMPAPLVPSRPPSAGLPSAGLPSADLPSAGLTSKTPKPTDVDSFAQTSINRHRAFIEKESAAKTDQERLELFAEFIVAESRLRRDKYSAAFDSMASDILDLTRDMWRSYNSGGRRSTTPITTAPQTINTRTSRSSMDDYSDSRTTAPSPASSANYTPITEGESPASATPGRTRGDAFGGFQPCLSPIPSMAMSTVPDPDEEGSRGRSASRWWEESANGSAGRGGKKLERSKRESKYMGLPREAREHLQWEAESSPRGGGTPGPSEQTPSYSYGPNEYPPEKVGWHDNGEATPGASTVQFYMHSAPATPDPWKLDVSRLVTLPPPYPRHHPALENNHPDLANIRSNWRALTELDDSSIIKERFKTKIATQREQEKADANQRRQGLRMDIQEKIRDGYMSFADAAKTEAEFDAAEAQYGKQKAQQEFDTFQKEVFNPLNALFLERIRRATASIDHLRNNLFDEAQKSNPNLTQEEGDEQPELLETLTLLKWLFEARDLLHREHFELEDERNDRYKAVILTPYILAGNDAKYQEAENFFKQDRQDRKVAFEKDTLKRIEEFMSIIEENVTRGVELQLSAFWDIAPGLLTVIQKVPSNLHGFEILIPPTEYEESPQYHDYPMQYLYSLLVHTEKSAYQFIESQTNLLCLLHEVKTGVMTAGSRLLETQRLMAGENFAEVDAEMNAVRHDEEARLTADLKEKVGLVEGQWAEALGKGLADCKERVEEFLVQQGGWDESLQV
ncbi:hypothetical protein M501DRAFT_998185 [Patellaria atrata CBS 101060]|uniref:Uncharacterized protein n=1 Tax=Patellaria atrata CBS 101060 TaxID=1346257 RepID=A0A9P4VSE7_9PEZI|nr:hypothetical protein M501DRAFT_998185 [Patellaria atrata CBS 101060]